MDPTCRAAGSIPEAPVLLSEENQRHAGIWRLGKVAGWDVWRTFTTTAMTRGESERFLGKVQWFKAAEALHKIAEHLEDEDVGDEARGKLMQQRVEILRALDEALLAGHDGGQEENNFPPPVRR